MRIVNVIGPSGQRTNIMIPVDGVETDAEAVELAKRHLADIGYNKDRVYEVTYVVNDWPLLTPAPAEYEPSYLFQLPVMLHVIGKDRAEAVKTLEAALDLILDDEVPAYDLGDNAYLEVEPVRVCFNEQANDGQGGWEPV